MHIIKDNFGYSVYGERVGNVWLSLVESILQNGQLTIDEGRKRYSLQNVRIKCGTASPTDPLIEKYANKKNIEEILKLTFNDEKMYDIDIIPSFSPGSKSYYARLKDWKMIDFVVKRLTEIPESKKAIMSFIRGEDYEKVLENPHDDYLPCITSIQFRLLRTDDQEGYRMNTIFNARSIDAYQKSAGNLVAIAMLGKIISERLEKNLRVPVWPVSIDGLITDAHIYENTLEDAKNLISTYYLTENREIHEKTRKIIVFEGIDGVGKSTQARLLYFALKRKGYSVDLYHFPSDTAIGNFIRSLLKNKKFDLLDERARALLTTADFYDQYSKHKHSADIIIFDRYIHSNFVSNHGLDRNWINLLHKYAPNPDIVFFMTCDIEAISKRRGADFGAKNIVRQEDFYYRYKKTFKDIPKIEIDASQELEAIHVKVMKEIQNKLNI